MIASKLPQVGTTIFTVMSKLAVEENAINLGQGFPNFPMDGALQDAVYAAMKGGFNQYSPMAGVPQLRERIAAKINSLYGHTYDYESEITITAGATQAIYTAITALIHEGDEVILFGPAYDCYAPALELCKAKQIWINLTYPDFSIPWDQVKSAITSKTKMIIINTPHNPSGTVMTEKDMLQLQQITHNTDIVVLSDEVYEHIVFDGGQHPSASAFDDLRNRSIVVASFGKTFHCTGWKTGYVAAPKYLMTEFRKVHQYNVFVCNTPIQYGIATYLENPQHYLSLPDFYQQKRDYFVDAIRQSRFEFTPSTGTYFQTVSFKNISDEKDTDFAVRLTKEFKLASIPLSVFYPDGLDQQLLRFCFAKDDETLKRAATILVSV